ncbi:hypothetical protein AWENTII_010499 [Aspergillus wentii]
MHLQSVLADALSAIADPTPDDPILKCLNHDLDAHRDLVLGNPDKALQLADAKLRVFPFKDVETCWRRLYTDASIVKACLTICENCGLDRGGIIDKNGCGALVTGLRENKKELGISPKASWLSPTVHVLDKALIMTGAPLRETLVESLLATLQGSTLSKAQDTHSPPDSDGDGGLDCYHASKRRKLSPPLFPPDRVPAQSLQCPIPRLSAPSFDSIENHIHNVRTPLIITDAVEHWPAMSTRPWASRDYWFDRTFGGRRLVPVEVGRSYTDEGWGQRIMEFKEFVDRFIWRGENGQDEEDDDEGQTGYMAQHDLLAQIPALRKDISIPDYCYIDPPGPEPGTPVYLKKRQEQKEKLKANKSHPDKTKETPETTIHPEASDTESNYGLPSDPIINTWIGPSWTISPSTMIPITTF